MMQRVKSHRVRITATERVSVRVGAGMIDFAPGWEGPVVPDAFEQLMARGAAIDLTAEPSTEAAGQAIGEGIPETGEVEVEGLPGVEVEEGVSDLGEGA